MADTTQNGSTPPAGGHLKRPLRVLLILVGILIAVVVLVILLVSPITKYLVEKYDVKYTGREITMDRAYVNPFTGYVSFSNLKIHEYKSDSIFFSVKKISANFALHKMLRGTYEISELTLDYPRGNIIQIRKVLNFDDLITLFSSPVKPEKSSTPLKLNILKVKIMDGEFHYLEQITPINYFIKDVIIESAGMRYDSDTLSATFSFQSGVGTGGMKGNFQINFKTRDYRLAIVARKFDLNILEQYLRDLTNYGRYSANIDADLDVKGNYSAAEKVMFSGLLAVNDFRIGKTVNDDYASFEKLSVAIFELSPVNHKYLFDSVSLIHPHFKYERYDNSDNMEMMFGAKETMKAMDKVNSDPEKINLLFIIGNYIKELSKNFFRSNYKINRLAIYNGDLEFNDYAINEKFSIALDPVYIVADSISKNDKRVNLYLKTGIKPYGKGTLSLSINPKDSSDYDLQYRIQKMSAASFNPYLITYTSFPLDRGTLEADGIWHVSNGIIKSTNHLLVIDPRITTRLRNKANKWIPLRLIMAFVRERSNVIEYQIPISGNLKNPDFDLSNIIFSTLKNILIKPPTTGYGIKVKNIETEIEKSLALTWEFRCSSLSPLQEKFIEHMARFLAGNPGASITVSPQIYAGREKELIQYFEARKKYFGLIRPGKGLPLNEQDSVKVEQASVKDTLFVSFLNRYTKGSLLFTLQEKCEAYTGPGIVNTVFKSLNKERNNAFMSIFRERKLDKQVKFLAAENTVPFNGFSYYKISYKGEVPESLLRAYRKMNQLNKETPRKEFEALRSRDKKKP